MKITEETLKCPLCGKNFILYEEGTYSDDENVYNCSNSFCSFYLISFFKEEFVITTTQINSIKQKSYEEGYEKGKNDGQKKVKLKRINIVELRSSILEEISNMDLSIYSSMRSAYSAIIKLTIHRSIKELEK